MGSCSPALGPLVARTGYGASLPSTSSFLLFEPESTITSKPSFEPNLLVGFSRQQSKTKSKGSKAESVREIEFPTYCIAKCPNPAPP